MPAFARCVLFTGETKGLKPGLWCQYILVFSLFHLALKSQRVETVSEFFGILCKPWLLEHSCSGSQIGWPNQFSLAEIWQERSAFLFGIWVKVVLFMPLTITLCVCVGGAVYKGRFSHYLSHIPFGIYCVSWKVWWQSVWVRQSELYWVLADTMLTSSSYPIELSWGSSRVVADWIELLDPVSCSFHWVPKGFPDPREAEWMSKLTLVSLKDLKCRWD